MSHSSSDQTLAFDYIKSNYFRTARADGVWGGPNGHLDLVMAFYSERSAIPQHIVHVFDGDRLGDEIKERRVSRDAVVREVEFCASMSLSVAKGFRDWLDANIKAIEEMSSKQVS